MADFNSPKGPINDSPNNKGPINSDPIQEREPAPSSGKDQKANNSPDGKQLIDESKADLGSIQKTILFTLSKFGVSDDIVNSIKDIFIGYNETKTDGNKLFAFIGNTFKTFGSGFLRGVKELFNWDTLLDIAGDLLGLWFDGKDNSLKWSGRLNVPNLIMFVLNDVLNIPLMELLDTINAKEAWTEYASNASFLGKYKGGIDYDQEAKNTQGLDAKTIKANDINDLNAVYKQKNDAGELGNSIDMLLPQLKMGGVSGLVQFIKDNLGFTLMDAVHNFFTKKVLGDLVLGALKDGLNFVTGGLLKTVSSIKDVTTFVTELLIPDWAIKILQTLGAAAKGNIAATASCVKSLITLGAARGIDLLLKSALKIDGKFLANTFINFISTFTTPISNIFDPVKEFLGGAKAKKASEARGKALLT